MQEFVSLEEAEAAAIAFSDNFAQKEEWELHNLDEPVADLEIFFAALRGKKILDAGCGWGRYVYRFLDADLSYTGVDHSNAMLEAARAANQSRAQFLKMSLHNLMFAEQYFDGIWCAYALGSTPKYVLPDILSNMHQILKPGGILAISLPFCDGFDAEGWVEAGIERKFLWSAQYSRAQLEAFLICHGFRILDSVDRSVTCGSFMVVAEK